MLATTIQHSNTTPHHQSRGDTTPTKGVLSQDPTVCPMISSRRPDHIDPRADTICCAPGTDPLQTGTPTRHDDPPLEPPIFVVLLRKEVIQPHLPVRLPCYDFVPIADPTFDSSPHKG
jgi:hypothetical protein